MRLLLRTGFDRFTGYGNDAVDLAMALQRAGVDVTPWPTSLMPGLPREFLRMLEPEPRGPYDVAMTFAPPFDIRPVDFAQLGRIAVGYSMWERSKIVPADMHGPGRWRGSRKRGFWSDLQPDANGRMWRLDAMIVTCDMNVEAFQNVDDRLPYFVVPCGIDPDDFPFQERDDQRPRRFGMIGMLAGRKDPFVFLEAWKVAKEETGSDAELWLHTLAPGLHPKITEWLPDVRLTERAMTRAELNAWYGEIDVLVSTSRGEGNNKPAMEFMATGGTVMATNWSGHQNWLMPGCTIPLEGRLMQVSDQSDALEFRVDKEDLTAKLVRAMLRPRADLRMMGHHAHEWITASLSWDRVGEQMAKTLMTIEEQHGG